MCYRHTAMCCSNYGGLLALLPLARRLSLRTLICLPLLANAAVMGLAVALGAATSVGGAVVIALTLPAAGLTGATTACLQAGTFALASYFPPRYMQVRKHHVDATANDDCTAGSSGRRAAAALGSPPAITVCESAQAILEGQAVATTGNCAASSASLSCCS